MASSAPWSLPATASLLANTACTNPGEGVSKGSPSRNASAPRVRARSKSDSKVAFQAAAASTAAQRLKETKPRGAVGAVVKDDHRLGGEVMEGVAHIPRRELVACGHGGRGVGIEAPREDSQAIEDRAIAFVEQRIGPLDGGTQRL